MSSTSSSIPGTNVPPVSFPGIASGIDYNSIIQKLTAMSMQQTVGINAQIATLNNANTELIKINGMLASVQSALSALGDSSLYDAVSASSSNSAVATAAGINGQSATPGTYTIFATQLATATQITGAPNAGHVITDAMPGTTATGADVPLADSWAAITPTNGGPTSGSVTINGVTVNYDVNSQSLNTIVADINNAEHAAGDAGFSMQLTGGAIQITDSGRPISLGASTDKGNLLQVLRLDQAAVSNTATAGTVIATGGVGGINQALEFNSVNASGQTTDANYLTPVTSGTFTINGVQIKVDAAMDNLASVIKRINASAAGVVASYNSATGQITLTSKNTGPQSIVVGSSSDTSNFLSATGLTAASGATSQIGSQASVTMQQPSGAVQTYYSNSNTVTNAIPGVSINLLGVATAQFQITVSKSTTQLVGAVTSFVSAYNAAINEINTASAPPVVASAAVGSSIGVAPTQSVGGGVLYNNSDVQSIKDELVNMVTAFNSSNGAYSSLSSIGLNLTDSFTQIQQSTSGTGSSAGNLTTTTLQGTDGQLQPIDVSKLSAAISADPTSVQNLFLGSQGLVTQMGSYLTGVTGSPTFTPTGLLGNIPSVSLLQGFENSNTSQVQSLQQQVTQIEDNVNMQADQLRQEFVNTEGQISKYQSLQSQLGSFFKQSGG